MQVRIKHGASIFQDFQSRTWPQITENPDIEFTAEWNGRYWDCRADGYGHLTSRGDTGDYGNGSILVHGYDNVEIIGT